MLRTGMLALALLAALAALTAWSGPGGGAPARADDLPDLQALLRRVDELWRGNTSRAQMTMIVKTERYERTMTMEMWSEGQENSLVKIIAPKKDQGIATLKVDKNIWNYLPKINRVTKIPASMMTGSWMGSHFTNDDLVKESSYEEDYESKITFSGQRDGQPVYEVTSLPRPEAPVVWGKVVMTIHQRTLMPIVAKYFDEEGVVARTMSFEAPKSFNGRTLPTRLVLLPEDKPGESTTVIYDAIRFDVELPAGLFTLRGLRAN